MRKQLYISLLAAILALPLLMKAQDTVVSDSVDVSRSRDIETSDVVSDSVPTWYVAPEIPEALRAPMRAAAVACLTDSILTFNADSVLIEGIYTDYDAAGRVIRETSWNYNPTTGVRTGVSKVEYGFDARGQQVYTATFVWNMTMQDWVGSTKNEYVYNEINKMESRIEYIWVNKSWLPQAAYTYVWDAAGRETEYTSYTRNASLNRLVPSQCHIQVWYNNSKKTLDINYTAYSNGAWSAGNKKEYTYDSKGNQIDYIYYSSYTNGNWGNSTHELWTYNASNKKTLYEKYAWSNGAWVTNTKEVFDYDAAGNNIFYEKYTGSNNQWKGSKKEDYTYNSAKKKIETITYKWTTSGWAYNTKTITPYDSYNNQIENTKYTWSNGAWKGSGTRTVTVYNASKQILEKATYSWGNTDWEGITKIVYTYSGSRTITEANYIWLDAQWVGTTKEEHLYNAAGQNDTTRTYTWVNSDWEYVTCAVNSFDSHGNQVLSYAATWNGTAWVMSSMTRADYQYDASGRVTLLANWQCDSDSVWIGVDKTTYVYDAHGNTSLSSEYEWSLDINDWRLTAQRRLDMEYDDANNNILNASYVLNIADSTWRGIDKFEYIYDSRKNPILQKHFVWNVTDWREDWVVEKQYNAQGKLILDTRSTWSNGKLIGNYRYEYDYTANGTKIKDIWYKWNTSHNDWEGLTRLEYEYTGTKKISETSFIWNMNLWSWTGSYKYTYVHDNQGREIERIYLQYSVAQSDWANVNKVEYGYNSRGTNNRTENFEWLNNAWSTTSLVEKIYDDADNKLRREKTGSWSSGIVTSFTDKHYFYSCDSPANNNGAQPRTPTELEEIDENYDTNVQPFDPMLPTYNLQGQSVDPATYHGIVIQNGKKYVL